MYDTSDIPLLDAAMQQVVCNAVPDRFFDRETVANLSHLFVHDNVDCELKVASGSTALRHNNQPAVGCHYSLSLVKPNGSESAYLFCVVDPSDDRALNRQCATQCLHLLKTKAAIRFAQLRVERPNAMA